MNQCSCFRRSVQTLFSQAIIALPVLILLSIGASRLEAAPVFSAPLKITDSAEKYQLSRNPHGAMAVDGSGTVHLTYWSGTAATTPQTPSYVYYRSWSPVSGLSAAEQIDDSTSDLAGGAHVGGRQSSLTTDSDGNVTVVWHDHRNCQPSPGNWIDNIEIYADQKPPGGTFSSSDLRLTTSSAAHLGDNGYMPAVTTAPDGRIYVIWYDFNADQNISDIYAKVSDASGNFNLAETMAEMRLTDLNNRSGSPAFSVCGASASLVGVHLLWTTGFAANLGDIYPAQLRNDGVFGIYAQLSGVVSSFFDPPRIDARGYQVSGVFTHHSSGSSPEIYLAKPSFSYVGMSLPIPVISGTWSATQPDLRIGSDGNICLVWLDDRNGGTQVFYGEWDPDTESFIDEFPVTAAGDWARAAISLDADDNVYILAEEDRSTTEGDIYFLMSYQEAVSSVSGWRGYR